MDHVFKNEMVWSIPTNLKAHQIVEWAAQKYSSQAVAIHSEAVWTGPFTLNWTKPNEMVWFGLGRLK